MHFKTSAMISIITPGDQAFFSISYIQVWTENRGSGLDKGDLLPQSRTQIPGGENRADNIIIKYTQPSKKAFLKNNSLPCFFYLGDDVLEIS